MCGKNVEVVERWVEEGEEEIMGEKVKAEYVVEVIEIHEDGTIHRLWLTRREGWSAERYELEFWGNKLSVLWRRKPTAFSDFKTVAELIYRNSFEEIPWWAIPTELGDFIATCGVKKTYLEILEYLRVLFSEPFEEVE
jgi:hypothetical protein